MKHKWLSPVIFDGAPIAWTMYGGVWRMLLTPAPYMDGRYGMCMDGPAVVVFPALVSVVGYWL